MDLKNIVYSMRGVSRFMLCVRGISLLSGLVVWGFLLRWLTRFDSEPIVWALIPMVLFHLWTIIKRSPGALTKTADTLVVLVITYLGVYLVDEHLYITWFALLHHPGGWIFAPIDYPSDFFISVGIALIFIINLIAVWRPTLPAGTKNPHIIAAYSFATILCVLLVILILVLAIK